MASPLQQFRQQHIERWTVMQDIPEWEVGPILEWVSFVFNGNDRQYHSEIVTSIETHDRLKLAELTIATRSWGEMRASLERLLAHQRYHEFLTFLGCLIKYVRRLSEVRLFEVYDDPSAERILSLLELCLMRGSKWSVVYDADADADLIERADPGLTQTAKDLDINNLTKAWNLAFGFEPEPEKAVESAQKAIEITASRAGLTAAKTSIYGNLLGDIRDHPDRYISSAKPAYDIMEKLSGGPKNPLDLNAQFSNWFWNGLDLIQKTNPGRHSSDSTEAFNLSPEAGKQSVLIATVICSLIKTGYFKKDRSNTT